MGGKVKGGWALRPGVELEGTRARQRVRVKSIEGDLAEISYLDGKNRVRRTEVVELSNLERRPIPTSDERRGRRATVPPRGWTAVEVGVVVALLRIGKYPTRISRIVTELTGRYRAPGAISGFSSTVGATKTEFVRTVVAAVVADEQSDPNDLPDVRVPSVEVRLGRIPGISAVRDRLLALGANTRDLYGKPDPSIPAESGSSRTWSEAEVLALYALSEKLRPEDVREALEAVFETRRSTDAVARARSVLIEPSERTAVCRAVARKLGVRKSERLDVGHEAYLL